MLCPAESPTAKLPVTSLNVNVFELSVPNLTTPLAPVSDWVIVSSVIQPAWLLSSVKIWSNLTVKVLSVGIVLTL